jgi:hypothetical protein
LVRNKWILLGVFVWIGIGSISAGGLRRRRIRRGHQGHSEDHTDSMLDVADVLLSLVHIVLAPVSLCFWVIVGILGIFGDADIFE